MLIFRPETCCTLIYLKLFAYSFFLRETWCMLIFVHETFCFWIISSVNLIYLNLCRPESCFILLLPHETCCKLIFLFLRLEHWYCLLVKPFLFVELVAFWISVRENCFYLETFLIFLFFVKLVVYRLLFFSCFWF